MSNLPKTSEITAGLGKARKTWIQEQEGVVGKSSHQNLAQPRKQIRFFKNQDPDLIYCPLYLVHLYYPNIN